MTLAKHKSLESYVNSYCGVTLPLGLYQLNGDQTVCSRTDRLLFFSLEWCQAGVGTSKSHSITLGSTNFWILLFTREWSWRNENHKYHH